MIGTSENSRLRVFISYTHRDEDAEDGRITELARDLKSEYQLISGNKMDLFIDRDSIGWGIDWRQAIDSGLEIASIFIPVLTPGYFKSENCRNELADFLSAVERNDEPKLILPLMYVSIRELLQGDSADPLVQKLSTFQVHKWNGRFFDAGTGGYRRCVNELAERLYEANEAIDRKYQQKSTMASKNSSSSDSENDATDCYVPENEDNLKTGSHETEEDIEVMPIEESSDDGGFLDRLDNVTKKMELSAELLVEVSEAIDGSTKVTKEYTDKINGMNGKSVKPATLINLFRKMSSELAVPSELVEAKGKEAYREMASINEDVMGLIKDLNEKDFFEDSTKAEFYGAIRNLNNSSQQAKGEFIKMDLSIDGIMGLSRDLNVPLGKMKRGLYYVLDTCNLINGWAAAIDAS